MRAPKPDDIYSALYNLGRLHLAYPAFTHFKAEDVCDDPQVCSALAYSQWAHVLVDQENICWLSITSGGCQVLRNFYGIEIVAHGAT
jgi:hypothetical protein